MFIHCPKCSSVATVPIAYGKPDGKTMEAHKYGLIHIAGCVIEDSCIDRHCQACGYEWASGFLAAEPHLDHHKQMIILLDQLEPELRDRQQSLERTCIDMGRHGIHGENCSLETLIETIHLHHEAWRDFTYGLHKFNGYVQIKKPRGGIQAEYDTETAHIYIKKHLWLVYSELGRLAMGCYRLGQASNKGSSDDIKRATINMQEARQALDRNWVQMRHEALSRSG
jgi:hypothetical protein